jgi:DNA-binding transcriptional LysR family regulator
MTPTPAGECFVRHARLMLGQVDRLAAEMQEFSLGSVQPA